MYLHLSDEMKDFVPQVALGDRYWKFYQMLNNAKKNIQFNIQSIFLRIIHSKKLLIYFFKELFIQRNYF